MLQAVKITITILMALALFVLYRNYQDQRDLNRFLIGKNGKLEAQNKALIIKCQTK